MEYLKADLGNVLKKYDSELRAGVEANAVDKVRALLEQRMLPKEVIGRKVAPLAKTGEMTQVFAEFLEN